MNPAPRLALGLLVPASNRILEGDFARWLPAGGRLHVNRLNAPGVRPEDMQENLQALTSGVGDSARLLGLAEPDVVAFGCTSGSFLRGSTWDASTLEEIRGASRCREVVLAAQAVVQALRVLEARTIVVVTPYPHHINDLMLDYFAIHGFVTLKLNAFDGWGGGGIHNIGLAQIEQLVMTAPYTEADAVVASCTNLRAGEMLERLETLTGKPVVTSNQATFWACARAAGLRGELRGLGRLGLL